jgi:hypothetical protein
MLKEEVSRLAEYSIAAPWLMSTWCSKTRHSAQFAHVRGLVRGDCSCRIIA